MDIFRHSLGALLGERNPGPPSGAIDEAAIKRLREICIALSALKYDGLRTKTLTLLSELFMANGNPGEAYRAASLVPEGSFPDRGGVLSLVGAPLPRAGSLNVSLEIISYCNMRCPLCTNSAGSGKTYAQHGKIMPFQTFRRIWDDIGPYTGLLILVGQGETFLHPDIYRILDYVKPTPVHIDTNGNVRLHPERLIGTSLSKLLFSLDGVDQRTYGKYRVGGSFEKGLDGLRSMIAAKRAAGRGPQLVWKYVVFKHNEAYLDRLHAMSREIGAESLLIVPCQVVPSNTESLIREFLPVGLSPLNANIKYVDFENDTLGINDEQDSPYCPAPLSNPHIRVNGDLEVCCSSYAPVGNVLKDAFAKIWQSEGYARLRKQILSDRYSVAECRRCSRAQFNYGRIFNGTPLEYPKAPEPSPAGTLWTRDLGIDDDYLAHLHGNGLTKDLQYYRARHVITEEQASPRKPPASTACLAA